MNSKRAAAQTPLLGQVFVLIPLSLVAGAVCLWTSSQPQAARPSTPLVIAMAAAFLLARLLPIRLPQGDEVYPTLMIGLVGLALVTPSLLVMASIVGGGVDTIAHFAQSSRIPLWHRLVDTLRGSVILGLMAPMQLILHPLSVHMGAGDRIIVWALAAACVYMALDVASLAVQQSINSELPLGQSIVSLARPLTTVYIVHIPMGVVVLRLQSPAQTWAFPVALLLTLILQNSFNLYLRIRRAYAETISALAHAAELDRPHDSGHARRVADLSVTVGRAMGLPSKELEKIGYAALLHDIGRMGSLGDDEGALHAERGAEIAASIPFLSDVAALIAWSPTEGQPEPPIGWTIVHLCSRYDRLSSEHGPQSALRHLRAEDALGVCEVLERLIAVGYSRSGSSE